MPDILTSPASLILLMADVFLGFLSLRIVETAFAVLATVSFRSVISLITDSVERATVADFLRVLFGFSATSVAVVTVTTGFSSVFFFAIYSLR